MERTLTGSLVIFLFSAALAASAHADTPYRTIDTDQLHSMVVDNAYKLEGGRPAPYTVIDTRSADRYHQGHIFSAINVQAADLSASLPMLPRDTGAPIVLYGDADLKTCRDLVTALTKAGYGNIQVYSDPFEVWKEKHLPVVQRMEPGQRP